MLVVGAAACQGPPAAGRCSQAMGNSPPGPLTAGTLTTTPHTSRVFSLSSRSPHFTQSSSALCLTKQGGAPACQETRGTHGLVNPQPAGSAVQGRLPATLKLAEAATKQEMVRPASSIQELSAGLCLDPRPQTHSSPCKASTLASTLLLLCLLQALEKGAQAVAHSGAPGLRPRPRLRLCLPLRPLRYCPTLLRCGRSPAITLGSRASC